MRHILYIIVLSCFIMSCSRPDATFVAQYTNGASESDEMKFINRSQNCTAYTWYFADGTMSNEENPTHKFNVFGNVMIVLEGRNGQRIDRDTQFYTITEPERKKVKIETPYGEMIAELYNSTPQHRDNFLKLASESYYDGLLFHRTMNNFMIQGGDPDSRGAGPDKMLGLGDPGYTIPPEIREFHFRGALAGARQPDHVNPNRVSSGSQFYIVDGKQYSPVELMNIGSQYGIVYPKDVVEEYGKAGGTPFLDNQYTVFGRVIEGLSVIDSISEVKTNGANRPIEDVGMKVSVIE